MTTSNPGHPSGGTTIPEDSSEPRVSLLELVEAVLRRRWPILAFSLLLAAAMLVRSVASPTIYTATALFMPSESTDRGSPLFEMGRQFGLDFEARGDSRRFFATMLETRPVLDSVLAKDYSDPSLGGGRAMDLATIYGVEQEDADARLRGARKILLRNLSTSADRQDGTISLTVRSRYPSVAEQIAQELLLSLNRFNVQYRMEQAERRLGFIAERLDEGRLRLQVAEDSLKVFLQENRQFEHSPTLIFEYNRLERSVAHRQQVYTSLNQSYEQAAIEVARGTPAISIIESPMGSAQAEPGSPLLLAGVGGLLGLLVGSLVVAAGVLIRAAATREEWEALRRAGGEAWGDIRHPLRRRRSFPQGD